MYSYVPFMYLSCTFWGQGYIAEHIVTQHVARLMYLMYLFSEKPWGRGKQIYSSVSASSSHAMELQCAITSRMRYWSSVA